MMFTIAFFWIRKEDNAHAICVCPDPDEPIHRLRSYFAAMEVIEAAANPQDFAREAVIALLRSRCQRREDPQQLSLFQ